MNIKKDFVQRILFLFFCITVGILIIFELFLNKKPSNFEKAAVVETVVNKENSELKSNPEDKLDNENQTMETLVADNDQSKSEKVAAPIDRPGQLVHHLFNIEQAPAAKGIAFNPANNEIWTTLLLNKEKGVSVFDSLTGEKVADINLANGGGVEIIFSSDGSKVYISQMETAKVFEVDAKSKMVLRALDTKSAWTKVIELSADGKTLFASNWSGDDISEIDLQSGKLLRQIPTVKTPRGLYTTSDGNFIYVAGFDRGEIEKIDLKTGKGKVIFKSGGAMRHIIGDEEKGVLYISDMGKNVIWQLFLKTDEIKKFADTDFNPNTIKLSPDKKTLFVSCRGKNFSADNYYIPGPEWGSVLLFDMESGEMLDAIVGGNQPTALDVSSDGKLLVFSDFLDARIEVFSVPSYDVLREGNGGRSGIYKSELKK
jgi:DNA-binding beta-propeller fold protein YncE